MRKTKPKKRILLPDPKFNDVLVTRFVNDLMVDGKKTVAFRIFYDALDIVEEKMAKKEEKPASGDLEAGIGEYYSAGRGKEPPCRWCYFPGADWKSTRPRKRAISVKNMILLLPQEKRTTAWLKNLLLKLWLPTKRKVLLSKRKKIPIVWLKLTGHLHISDFNLEAIR